jgi:phosphoglycerol transferase MdoB-like AlkP superfamily enzyme
MVEEGVCWFSDRAPTPLSSSRVLVVVDVFSSSWWWAVLSLMGAAAAVSVSRRADHSRLVGLFAVADVFWCAGSLVVKQGSVLATAGTHSTAGGLALTAGGACAVVLALLFLPAGWRVWCSWLGAAAGSAVLWADTLYVRFFGDLPGAEALSGLGQLGRVGASIRSLVEVGDFWLWADLLPGALLALVATRLSTRVGHRGRRITAVFLVAVTAAGVLSAYRLVSRQPDLLGQVFRRLLVAREVGVLNLHALDAGRWFVRTRGGSGLDSDRYDATVSWFADRAPLRAGVGPFFGAAEGLNLVMVQVESLQGFVIGLEVEGREVTPYLNRWRDDALWFTNVTDQTAQGRSSDSELATQVSLMPASGGAAAFRFSGNQFTGLAGIAGEHGYTTLSAVPYDGSFWNRRTTHRAYGFSQSLFVDDFAAGEAVGWGLSDRDFLDQAVDRLAALQQPFVASLLTLSLHHPFEGFPEHLEVLDVGRWRGTPFGSYLHTMRFFDESLVGFMAGLERAGLADSTVIVIWGDHDAGFEWRADIASAMGATHDSEGWYLSQEVPLFIRVPGRNDLRGERDLPAGHVDVAPTLLALLGIDPSTYAFVGRNLLGAPGDPPVVGEYACWRNRRQLFLQGDGTLESGLCLDVSTMQRMPVGRCADGFEAARLTTEISASVLEHDLQRRIHHELGALLGGVR